MTDSLTFLREHAKQHRIEADATNSMDERTKHLVFAKHFTAVADELERLRSRVADYEQQDSGSAYTAMMVEIDGHQYALRPNAAYAVMRALLADVRYRTLANAVLACDYGDNSTAGRMIGWGIRLDRRDGAPFMYGPSIDAAVDSLAKSTKEANPDA